MLILSIVSPENSVIVHASEWLVGLATSSLATGIAVIAIAANGFAMLGGRVDVRRGASAILGCFILLGAPTIAAALADLARSDQPAMSSSDKPVAQTAPAPPLPPQQDPYAGASLIR